MDILIFSKDRGFQLFSTIETLLKYVKGINNIFVQFSYSNDRFLEGYKKINNFYKDVIFIDETKYGFNDTLSAIIHNEVTSKNIFLEVDDNIFFNNVDLLDLENQFNNTNASKLSVGLNIKIFNEKYYTAKNNLAVIDKSKPIDNKIQELSLKYSFNVSSAIHRTKDIKELLNNISCSNPIDLEIKGSSSSIFINYPYNLYYTKEVCKQIHTNNFGKRYKEIYSTDILNNYLLNNEVLNLSSDKIKKYETDMRWFNGEDIKRFPIFPWEIPPIYHSDIFNNRKKIY